MRVSQRRWCVVLFAASLLGCGRIASSGAEGKTAPELDGGLPWLNSAPARPADLRGKVVLLDFFEYSCVNCIRTFPYLDEWRKRYANDGLVVVGVHTPQCGFSMDPQNVNAAVQQLGTGSPEKLPVTTSSMTTRGAATWKRKARACTISSANSPTAHTTFDSSSKAAGCRFIRSALALAKCH